MFSYFILVTCLELGSLELNHQILYSAQSESKIMLKITTCCSQINYTDDFFFCVYFETFMYCFFCAISKENMNLL